MTFLRHRWTSRRRTPLWVLLLGVRQPRVVHTMVACDETEDVAHRDRHRWKRSLRVSLVFRSLSGLRAWKASAPRSGQTA